jgi:catechol 2,3-dioxygenase-like lactoylglutathione lyase family enzyme
LGCFVIDTGVTLTNAGAGYASVPVRGAPRGDRNTRIADAISARFLTGSEIPDNLPRMTPEKTPLFRRMDHMALHVADVAAAADFYTETLGFEKYCEIAGRNGRRIIFVRLGDSIIELTTRPGGEPMSGFHFCLDPIDFDAAVAALEKRNLPVAVPPQQTAPRGPSEVGWRRAVFQGPHGELIEIRG